MQGLHVGRVFLFFLFSYSSTKYLCALIQWFSTISEGPDEDTGMWIVQPDLDANREFTLEVVHVNCILHGAHLIPVYGHNRLPIDIWHTNSLDIFRPTM
ncbi:hypothetical protein SCLCIDRAFT_141185 [Scleroderma citrinum Foug A]|uniref:Uncharacterized protein n=1 Tax=Scleroderma citrinum Foug A TaxID=1036808 RepID=A0A0C3CUY9_9AGAM|nr:hypothetical protein SCLCIDRAFT_141185 [Scleroderma citrinum Foug A]